jgi:two-component system chemotaxis sensor kinase CheA
MNGLQEQFVSEARELIQVATEDLIAAEREGFSAERSDRVFRAFHTLKGAAGVVDLPAMGVTMHAAEDLLAAVSAGRIVSSPAVIDQILACLDQVSNWVDSFEVNQAEPERAGDDALKVVNALRTLLAPTVSAAPAHASLTNTGAGLPDWAKRLVESSRGKATGADQNQSAPLNALSYQPHAGCFFNGDDPLGLMRRVPQLLALRIEQRAAWPPLAELDPFSCNLHIQALSAATRAELATLFRLVPDQVRIVEVPSNLPANDRAALVQAVIEEQKQVLSLCQGRDDHSGRIGSATRTIANALRHHGNDDWAKRVNDRRGVRVPVEPRAAFVCYRGRFIGACPRRFREVVRA